MNQNADRARAAYETAAGFERTYHGCAQCTLAGIQSALGIQDALLFQAATGLAAGGGLTTDGACGAYNGAVLAMSSVFGRSAEHVDDDRENKYRGFDLARRLHNRFFDRYGSLQCRAIQEKLMGRSFDLWDSEDRIAFDGAGGHSEHCPAVCGTSAEWAVDLVLKEIDAADLTLESVQRDFLERRNSRADVTGW